MNEKSLGLNRHFSLTPLFCEPSFIEKICSIKVSLNVTCKLSDSSCRLPVAEVTLIDKRKFRIRATR